MGLYVTPYDYIIYPALLNWQGGNHNEYTVQWSVSHWWKVVALYTININNELMYNEYHYIHSYSSQLMQP